MACRFCCSIVTVAVLGVLLAMDSIPGPQPPRLEELSPILQEWRTGGRLIPVFERLIFVREEPYRGSDPHPETFLLVHGFPSSSFEYHLVAEDLAERGRVVMFDHIGFGFSDKPSPTEDGFTYSLGEMAEITLEVWRQLGVTEGHVIAHDMGDSVVTEILTRWQRDMLPPPFHFQQGGGFFKSVTFSNGGMRLKYANLRITQYALLSPIGRWLNHLIVVLDSSNRVAHQQLASIWGPDADKVARDNEIKWMMELNAFNGGRDILYATFYYLTDRRAFEQRWMRSLRALDQQTGLHPRLLWGDSDAVAPLAIAEAVVGDTLTDAGRPVVTIPGAGHFLMLEQPEAWTAMTLELVSN